MDFSFIAMATSVAVVLWLGWRRWPAKIAPSHEEFRLNGEAQVFRCERFTGRLVPTGLTLNASAIKFADKATFVLLPPMMQSRGVANLNGQAELKVKAVTQYPGLRSYFVTN